MFIKKIQIGFNPNSSSIGTMLWAVPWAVIFLSPLLVIAGIFFAFRIFSRPDRLQRDSEQGRQDSKETVKE